jgi:hypothetical protein
MGGEIISLFVLSALFLFSSIELLVIGRSRTITFDKQQDTLTMVWSSIVTTKSGKKTRVWALSDVKAVVVHQREIRHRRRKRGEVFKICLALKSRRQLPITEYTLSRHRGLQYAHRIWKFLELDGTVRTPGWSTDKD